MFSVLKLQLRVILALVLRETRTRFGRTKLGYFWALFEPIAYVAVSAAIYTFMGRRSPVGDNIIMFFVVGYLPFLMFRSLATRLTKVIDAGDGLLTFPVIKPPDILFAKIVLEVSAMTVVTFLIFVGIAFFDEPRVPDDPLSLMAALCTIIILGSGLGIINSVIIIFVSSWDRIFPVLFRLLYVISGVYWVTDRLPPFIRDIVVWSPINHCIEWVRQAFFVGYVCNSLDRSYPLLLGLILIVVGLSAERALRRKVLST
jgi:capsular polysaccharide transport system permease protein